MPNFPDHLADLYDVEMSTDTVGRIIDQSMVQRARAPARCLPCSIST